MKHLKSYKVFESSWSIEEYISEIESCLSRCDVTPSYLSRILEFYKEYIQTSLEEGVNPRQVAADIISTMDLSKSGNAMGINFPGVKPPTTIKYL